MLHARGWRNAKELATLVYRESERKHLALAAAGVAYYFLMSLVPALAFLTAVVASLPLLNESDVLVAFLGRVMPAQALHMLEEVAATNHCRYGQTLSHHDCTGTSTERARSTNGPTSVNATAVRSNAPTASVSRNASMRLIHGARGVRTS